MCRHNIAEVFPRQSDLPKTATEEERLDLFSKIFRQPTDWVICQKCGKIGHYIKSRRGGIRWHREESSDYRKETFAAAYKCWKIVGKKAPDFVSG